jgi:hypothetical protein
MKNGKYFIALFCNKKKVKILYKCMKRTTVYEYWREFKTERKPPFIKLQGGKRNLDLTYELVLIFPNNRWATKTFIRDSLGRNVEAIIEDKKFRIKEMIPFWEEELIYDFQIKKHIRFHQLLEQFLPIQDISQIFILNNKLFLQIEENILMFGNKNITDAERLFEIVKDELLKRKRGNFIFIKDITTHQRKLLYNMLEAKGFKRTELFRHYSY